jgi:hypothetical protein
MGIVFPYWFSAKFRGYMALFRVGFIMDLWLKIKVARNVEFQWMCGTVCEVHGNLMWISVPENQSAAQQLEVSHMRLKNCHLWDTWRTPFMALCKEVLLWISIAKNGNCSLAFSEGLHVVFEENMSSCVSLDTKSQTNRQTCSHKAIVYFIL